MSNIIKCKVCGSTDTELDTCYGTFGCNICGVEVEMDLVCKDKEHVWEWVPKDRDEYVKYFETVEE